MTPRPRANESPSPSPPYGGESSSSLLGKRGREYHGSGLDQGIGEEYNMEKRKGEAIFSWEEYQVEKGTNMCNVEKREREANVILPTTLRLLGRISSGEKGKGLKFC